MKTHNDLTVKGEIVAVAPVGEGQVSIAGYRERGRVEVPGQRGAQQQQVQDQDKPNFFVSHITTRNSKAYDRRWLYPA